MPKVSHQHKEQRRLEIITAGKKVFIQKGYEAATMQDVIEEVGLSRGAVYSYFSNKEDLFLSVLEVMDHHNFLELERDIQKTPSVWTFFLKLLKGYHYESNDEEHRSIGWVAAQNEYFYSVRHIPEKRQFIKERYEQYVKLFSNYIEKGVQKKEFHPIFPNDTIVRYMFTFTDGMNMAGVFITAEDHKRAEQIEALLLTLKYMLGIQKETDKQK